MESFLDPSGMYFGLNFSFGNLTNYEVVTDNGDEPVPGLAVDKAVVPALFFIMVVSGISANSAALTVMYKARRKLRVTDLYLVNHFIANIIFLAVFVPFIAIAYGITDWIFGDFCCRFVNYGMTFCLAASLLSVTVACLHHSLGYGRGQNHKSIMRNHRCAKIIIAAIWIVAGVTMVPRVFLYRTIKLWHIIDERRFCTRRNGPVIYRQVDTCITCLSLYFLPLLVQAACHIRVFRDLKKLGLNGLNISPRQTVAKVLTGMSVAFLIGWLPTQIINLSEDFSADIDGGTLLFKHREVIAYGFSYVSLSTTPLVYYICKKRLRNTITHSVSKNDEALIVAESARPTCDIESSDAHVSDYLQQSRQNTTSL